MPEEWLIIISENDKLKRMANNSLKRGSVYNKMADFQPHLCSPRCRHCVLQQRQAVMMRTGTCMSWVPCAVITLRLGTMHNVWGTSGGVTPRVCHSATVFSRGQAHNPSMGSVLLFNSLAMVPCKGVMAWTELYHLLQKSWCPLVLYSYIILNLL